MKDSEILKEAKKLIENPENWTQHAYARTKHDQIIHVNSPLACKFCSLGAVEYLCDSNWSDTPAVMFLAKAADGPIGLYNDNHTHEEVMQAWDKAIALAEQAEEA